MIPILPETGREMKGEMKGDILLLRIVPAWSAGRRAQFCRFTDEKCAATHDSLAFMAACLAPVPPAGRAGLVRADATIRPIVEARRIFSIAPADNPTTADDRLP